MAAHPKILAFFLPLFIERVAAQAVGGVEDYTNFKSTTITSTTTSTTKVGANCTATHMTCPVASVAWGVYQVLGSENARECSMQSSGGESFFHFAYGECNSTRRVNIALNFVEEIVTLIYRPPSFGSLLVGTLRHGSAAVVVCTCTAPLTALASSGSMEYTPEPATTLKATASVTVGNCSQAQSMAGSNTAAVAFQQAMANLLGIPSGNVKAALTAACPRRLLEKIEAAVRQLAMASVQVDYNITVPDGTQASVVENSLKQNTMVATLTGALNTELGSTPEFAHVSVSVTGITNIVVTTPSAGPSSVNHIVGNAEFGVSLEMYATDSFNTALPLGSLLPASLSRLYFKVVSDSTTDFIGLVDCTASPTSNIEDPYAARFVKTSCAVGPLDYHAHIETETHAIHSSILNFKFAGSTDVFIWCSVIRCLTESCGKCANSGSRRLGSTLVSRQLQGQGTSVQAWFQTQFSTAAVILPGPLLSQSTGLVVWEPVAAPLLSSSDMRSNLTLFGFAPNASTSLEHLADAVTAALSSFFLRKVQVLRILAVVLPNTRLLSAGLIAGGSLRTEATTVENVILAVHEGDHVLLLSKLTSLSHDGEVAAKFAHSLRIEMESRGLNTPAHLQVEVGRPPSIAAPATPMFGQVREDSGASGILSVTSAIIILCVACLFASCVYVFLACLWWKHKSRQSMCPKSAWRVKIVDTTKDANALRPASALEKTSNTTHDVGGKNDKLNQGNGASGFLAISGKKDESNQGNGVSGFLDTT